MFLGALALHPVAVFAKTTAEEARTLPVEQLAKRLLGDSGSLMIDLDRPRFEGILEPVRFYSRAEVTGSQFGICGADWVTVSFDDDGNVDGLSAERRYGVAGDVYPKPGWTHEQFGKICSAVKSTRDFFPAPDAQSALEIVWFVDAISGRGPYSMQDFQFSCTGWCRGDKSELKYLVLGEIDAAKAIDCPKSNLKIPSCFEVTVGESKVGPFPKKYRIFGTVYMNNVVVTDVAVDVGQTLQ